MRPCLVKHCEKSVRIRSYSAQMREDTDWNKSEYGQFLRSKTENPI